METPRAEIIHLNPDCQGTHYPQHEIDELCRKNEFAKELVKLMDHALTCYKASYRAEDLWEAWIDNLNVQFEEIIAKAKEMGL